MIFSVEHSRPIFFCRGASFGVTYALVTQIRLSYNTNLHDIHHNTLSIDMRLGSERRPIFWCIYLTKKHSIVVFLDTWCLCVSFRLRLRSRDEGTNSGAEEQSGESDFW